MMGRSTKVSFHATGDAQWSMISEWYAKNRPNQPNRLRHIEKWKWSIPGDGAASHVFRISIPSSELRQISTDEDLNSVRWLADPGEKKKVGIECYVVSQPAVDAPDLRPDDLLQALELHGGRSLLALYRVLPVGDADADLLMNVRRRAATAARERGFDVQPEFRSVASFTDGNGVHGMSEFVPFQRDAASTTACNGRDASYGLVDTLN
jgi:hypothetical protein